MPNFKFTMRVMAGAVAACLAGGVLIAQSNRAEQEKRREAWQRVADIFQAMGVRSGATVADVGAGDGFFTTRLAAAVGPSGRVFAVDVDDAQLDRLRRRLTEDGRTNVTAIKGTSTDPQLPAGTLDAALIVNAYHEMPEHQAMLMAIRNALKPQGRLVIVEPISEKRRPDARPEQTRGHEIAPEFVMQDLRAAGLRIIGLEDPFTKRVGDTEWMLTATPGAAPTAATSSPAAAPAATPEADWRSPSLRISADDLVKLKRVTIIDVRDAGMFAEGHLPDAILIPLEDIESSAERLRSLSRPFVTYCS